MYFRNALFIRLINLITDDMYECSDIISEIIAVTGRIIVAQGLIFKKRKKLGRGLAKQTNHSVLTHLTLLTSLE